MALHRPSPEACRIYQHFQFLARFDAHYDSLQGQLLFAYMLPSLEAVFSKILNEEGHRQLMFVPSIVLSSLASGEFVALAKKDTSSSTKPKGNVQSTARIVIGTITTSIFVGSSLLRRSQKKSRLVAPRARDVVLLKKMLLHLSPLVLPR